MPVSTDSPALPHQPPASAATARLPYLLAIVVLMLLLLLSLGHPSSTRILTWPLALPAAFFWLASLGLALGHIAKCGRGASLGPLADGAFSLLALAGLAATALSPLSELLMHTHLPVFLGALALPYALRPAQEQRLLAPVVLCALAATFLTGFAVWFSSAPGLRLEAPFGHANTSGAVAALSAPLALWLGFRSATPSLALRCSAVAVALLAVLTAFASSSRSAVLALVVAVAVAAGLTLLRQGRRLAFLCLTLLALAVALGGNERLRELVLEGRWSAVSTESNAQRLAMLKGGLALAAERPWVGWGPGSVPHVFQRVRAELPGEPDNYLQLHNTPVQVLATLGVAGALAGLLLLVALARAARTHPPTPARHALASALAAALTLFLFDHSLPVPLFAGLVALLAAAWLAPLATKAAAPRSPYPPAWMLLPGTAALLLVWVVYPDLRARHAYAAALDAYGRGERDTHLLELRRAVAYAPADPYYAHQLSARLALGAPFATPDPETRPLEAAALLEASLKLNPDLEYARYNLGWLLLGGEPTSAAREFSAAASLAPARGGVYHGLARARLASAPDDTESMISALAAECLLDPTFAWSPWWRDEVLAPHRAAALAHAATWLETRAAPGDAAFARLLRAPGPTHLAVSAHRRSRLGYGVLMGHPEGPPPPDFNVLLPPDLPPELAAALPKRGHVPPAALLAIADVPTKE
jgi:O-antigen ligase